MSAWFNSVVRWSVGIGLATLGQLRKWRLLVRAAGFSRTQARLRQRYLRDDPAPVVMPSPPGGRQTGPRDAFRDAERNAVFAALFGAQLRRRIAYSFRPFKEASPRPSVLSTAPELPRYLDTLVVPHRVQDHPAFAKLARDYGHAAVRLWVLTLSNPALIYSFRISDILEFFEATELDWDDAAQLVRDYARRPKIFGRLIRIAADRIASAGAAQRVQQICQSTGRLSPSEMLPGLEAVMTRPAAAAEQDAVGLERYLPAADYRRLPMFSVAAGSVATLTYFGADGPAMLPLAPRLLYEFLPEGQAPESKNLLSAAELEREHRYCLVVSDPTRVRCYTPGDVFTYEGLVSGVPDLRRVERPALAPPAEASDQGSTAAGP